MLLILFERLLMSSLCLLLEGRKDYELMASDKSPLGVF
jgi:hypothetical protein